MRDTTKKIYAAALVLSFAIVFAVYSGSLRHEFTYDDFVIVVSNPKVPALTDGNIKDVFATGEKNYLPVRALSYSIDYAIWGMNPTGFRITNLLLHALNVFLVFALILRMFGLSGDTGFSNLIKRSAAMIGAGLFAAHPLQVEAVAWVSGRKELLACFFVLAAFHAYLSLRASRQKNAFLFPATIFLFSLAVLSKSSAVCFPLLIAAADITFFYKNADAPSKHRIIIENIFIFLTAFLFVMLNISLSLRGNIYTGLHGGTLATHILTILTVPWIYLKHFIYPAMLSPEYSVGVPSVAAGAAAGLGLILVAAALLFDFRRNKPAFLFGAWFLLCLVPVSNIFPLEHVIADRYMYLPMAGLCAFAGTVISFIFKRNKLMAAIAGLLVVVSFAVLAQKQAAYWKNDLTLWTHAMEVAPDRPRVYHNIGEYYRRNGDTGKAIQYYKEALAVDPDTAQSFQMLSQVYYLQGDYPDAEKYIRELLRVRPDTRFAYHNLAHILLKQDRPGEAAAVYENAIEQFPDDVSFQSGLSLVRELMKRNMDKPKSILDLEK